MQSTLISTRMNETAYASPWAKLWYFCSTTSGGGLGLAGQVAGDDLDGAELAERAGEGEHDAVDDGPLDGRAG